MLGQFPSGMHEFADSVNNGPWSRALTAELVPYLESKYRMDAKPASRLLTGHSSGGWAGLWLQINYPKFFGGVWATSPDPVDFRSFTGPDITATPPENIYRKPDGSPWTLVREGGKDTMSLQDMVQQEKVLGEYGGQFQSFEAVFSPRGSDGRPMPLFDRETGEVDPIVAKAWEKYDIAKVVRARWKEIGPSLKGKVHIIVGTQDTYHLEQPVHLLEAAMKDLDSGAQFTYLEGKDHFDLYNNGLGNQIANEMYTAAHEKQ
jgi:S-formylglutathione hydrolase FrmB